MITVKIVAENQADIDALQPRAGASTQVVRSISEMNTRMKGERQKARDALAKVRQFEAKYTSADLDAIMATKPDWITL